MRFWVEEYRIRFKPSFTIDYEDSSGVWPELGIVWEDGTKQFVEMYKKQEGETDIYRLKLSSVPAFAGWLNEQPDHYFRNLEPSTFGYPQLYMMVVPHEVSEYEDMIYEQKHDTY